VGVRDADGQGGGERGQQQELNARRGCRNQSELPHRDHERKHDPGQQQSADQAQNQPRRHQDQPEQTDDEEADRGLQRELLRLPFRQPMQVRVAGWIVGGQNKGGNRKPTDEETRQGEHRNALSCSDG
jgi:hypothetical protein